MTIYRLDLESIIVERTAQLVAQLSDLQHYQSDANPGRIGIPVDLQANGEEKRADKLGLALQQQLV